MITIDGSQGEGGGQILRSSLALSLITGQAFHLKNIRARRAKPGLQPQHLMSVQAAASVSRAHLRGASLHSTDLVFDPGEVVPGNFHFPIRTAGATSLVLHTIFLPLALTGQKSQVTVEGGTHLDKAPSFHFLDTTWSGYLALLGLKASLYMDRPGFYPRGGGRVEMVLQPSGKLRPLNLEAVEWGSQAAILSAAAGLPESIAHRQAEHARQRLKSMGIQVQVQVEGWPNGPGTFVGITLATRPVPTLFCALGARGKPAEKVADDAVEQAARFLKNPGIDAHSADQLLLPLSQAVGNSRFPVAEITQHLLTNAQVLHHFMKERIQIVGKEGEPGWVVIEG